MRDIKGHKSRDTADVMRADHIPDIGKKVGE